MCTSITEAQLLAAAQQILGQYIAQNAPDQVNIDGDGRVTIERKVCVIAAYLSMVIDSDLTECVLTCWCPGCRRGRGPLPVHRS